MSKPKVSMSRHHIEQRHLARQMLVAAGHSKAALREIPGLVYAIEVELGRDRDCSIDDLVVQYVRHNKPQSSGAGEIVRPRTPAAFRPLTNSPQYLANLERARAHQPRLWTPAGAGNGVERQHGFGRGA